ncbi:MAG TPA: hypothetical protein V6C89_05890 [Drouetiella sp.]|jgi:hypothetical protein
MRGRYILMLAAVAVQMSSAAIADPLKGGIETKQVMGGAGDYAYPAPTMVQAPVIKPQAPVKAPPSKPLNATIRESVPVQRPPIQMQVQRQVVLPQGFMGSWRVQGQRSKVEAMPEFQAGAEQAFSLNTNNTWNIGGQPGSYSMSNGEMSTPLWVDKVEGGTAFIRYQHPVGKTMAQEAIVLSLIPGGAQFNGLERISIVKEGMAQPRAKVTYQLNGSRMR